MKLQRFQAGVKPEQSDLNSINENMQEALAALLSSFSNDPSGVLFDSIQPLTSLVGTLVTITTPAQKVGIQGCILQNSSYYETFDISDGSGGEVDLKVEIYFVMRVQPVTAVRNFLSREPTNGATVIQNLEVEIANSFTIDVVYLASDDLASTSQFPVQGPDQVGYVRLGEVRYSSATSILTVIPDDSAKFSLPLGTSVPVLPHGLSHLPGGTDAIPTAVLDSSVISGSSAGIMPSGALRVNLNSIQDVVPEGGSPFLTFASEGSNTVTNGAFSPKQVRMGMRFNESLTITDFPQESSLGVNFPPKTVLNGTQDIAARRDHRHSLSESGLVVINKQISVDSSNAGSVLVTSLTSADTSATLEQIIGVKYFWAPANLDATQGNQNNRVEMDWSVANVAGSGVGTIGARTFLLSPTSFQVELGSIALVYLTQAADNVVQGWTTPTYGGGSYPKAGTIHMVITAIREGASG